MISYVSCPWQVSFLMVFQFLPKFRFWVLMPEQTTVSAIGMPRNLKIVYMLSLHHLTIMNRYFKLDRRELFYASSQWWLHYICTQPSTGFLLALKSTSLTFIPKLEYIQAKIKILRGPTDSCSYFYEAQATILLYSRGEVNWMYYCFPFETL